jgi:dTDP-3-amino-2,3,6-trideoxy-4-keto-D-glucose/dTDP-3-amino-3,4,6-trideoxy-alpha-D-glucose/dTDP-2,6-dideoxy-D-kanosamine transaminase
MTKFERNFLPKQYENTGRSEINHNYLSQQFEDSELILNDIRKLISKGDYTLGRSVNDFEKRICALTGSKYCIGVGSGTDALFLSLKAAGVKEGDEIITTPYTFYATIGAIVTAGARPVFVDVREDYNINPRKIEDAITPYTKGIIPVHWGGFPCEMDSIMTVAENNGLFVVEDACHAIQARFHEKAMGTFGLTGCFSMHPLKNLNVWGDGGYLITDSSEMAEKLSLFRNHGLVNRDECAVFAYNSRLDSLQAIVANHLLDKINFITESRISNAQLYDERLQYIKGIITPNRPDYVKQVYHIYVVRAEKRDNLQSYLIQKGVDAKVHYPVPMHLQPAAKNYGYKRGDFPVCEALCDSVISLPVHEFVTTKQINKVCDLIEEFYAKN